MERTGFRLGDRVRAKYIIMQHDSSDGTVTQIKANKPFPTLVKVRLDRGLDWVAVHSDWALVAHARIFQWVKLALSSLLKRTP